MLWPSVSNACVFQNCLPLSAVPCPWKILLKWSESCSVMSDSLQPHGLCGPWNSPGQDTGAGGPDSLLQGIFPTQGSNPGLLHSLPAESPWRHLYFAWVSLSWLLFLPMTPWGFPGGSVVRIHLPIQETWIQFLDQEDSLKKEMATHSCILAWEIPWTEELGGLKSMESQKDQTQLTDKATAMILWRQNPPWHLSPTPGLSLCFHSTFTFTSTFNPLHLLLIISLWIPVHSAVMFPSSEMVDFFLSPFLFPVSLKMLEHNRSFHKCVWWMSEQMNAQFVAEYEV